MTMVSDEITPDVYIPDDIVPGRGYISLQKVVDEKITRYSKQRLSELARQKLIPSYNIAGRIVFSVDQIAELIHYENDRLSDPSVPGRKPERRRKATVHPLPGPDRRSDHKELA